MLDEWEPNVNLSFDSTYKFCFFCTSENSRALNLRKGFILKLQSIWMNRPQVLFFAKYKWTVSDQYTDLN